MPSKKPYVPDSCTVDSDKNFEVQWSNTNAGRREDILQSVIDPDDPRLVAREKTGEKVYLVVNHKKTGEMLKGAHMKPNQARQILRNQEIPRQRAVKRPSAKPAKAAAAAE